MVTLTSRAWKRSFDLAQNDRRLGCLLSGAKDYPDSNEIKKLAYGCHPERSRIAAQSKDLSNRESMQQKACPDARQALEVPPGFGPGNEGFADLCLTTWLWHQIAAHAMALAVKMER